VDKTAIIDIPGGADGGNSPTRPRGTVPSRDLFKIVAKSSIAPSKEIMENVSHVTNSPLDPNIIVSKETIGPVVTETLLEVSSDVIDSGT